MEIIAKIDDAILNPLIIGLFAVAVVYFLWGLVKFLQNQDNEEAQSEGKMHMFWGVVGIFIMMAVQGIWSFIESLTRGFTPPH